MDSLRNGRILRVSAKGEVSTFTGPSAEQEWRGLGMKVHPPSGRLWVCRADAIDSTASGLFAYDLKTGREVDRILLADQSGEHLLNDLAITEAGDIYVSDTEEGCLYWKHRDTTALVKYPLALPTRFANGVALSDDERLLFVAHSMGIVRIDLRSGQATKLLASPTVTLVGIDGLYWHSGDLVAIQNEVNPMRAVRFILNEDATRATACTILESGHPLFANVPTTGTVANDRFIFIANCQMNLMDDEGSIPDNDLLQDVVLLEVGL